MRLDASPWWVYAMLSAVFAALTTILAKIGVAGVSSNLATAIRTVVILVFAWAIVLSTGESSGISALSGRTLLFLVLSGFATGASWLFYFKALQVGKASQVAPIDKSSLVLILVFSVLFLGEPLDWKVIVAVLLITAGTLVLLL
ncbi:MAG TPA: EamA family transporter [Herpetosiphonaceae bacterium]|jgi:bacterial/archaeal transporter family protein|nr:EamA family transporter [Herpetosiphonaceae bacterium]